MKWIPQSPELMKGISQGGNTLFNSFFAIVREQPLRQGKALAHVENGYIVTRAYGNSY